LKLCEKSNQVLNQQYVEWNDLQISFGPNYNTVGTVSEFLNSAVSEYKTKHKPFLNTQNNNENRAYVLCLVAEAKILIQEVV